MKIENIKFERADSGALVIVFQVVGDDRDIIADIITPYIRIEGCGMRAITASAVQHYEYSLTQKAIWVAEMATQIANQTRANGGCWDWTEVNRLVEALATIS